MTGNGHVQFGGGLMEKGPCATSPAAYPTKAAVCMSAAAVIFSHNHPSGDPTPSLEDRTLTKRLVSAGELLGIRVLDHIVMGEGRHVSFADEGWLYGEG